MSTEYVVHIGVQQNCGGCRIGYCVYLGARTQDPRDGRWGRWKEWTDSGTPLGVFSEPYTSRLRAMREFVTAWTSQGYRNLYATRDAAAAKAIALAKALAAGTKVWDYSDTDGPSMRPVQLAV